MAPLPAPAEKPSHRVSDSQSHAKVRPPTQVAVFCAALWPNLQPALTHPRPLHARAVADTSPRYSRDRAGATRRWKLNNKQGPGPGAGLVCTDGPGLADNLPDPPAVALNNKQGPGPGAGLVCTDGPGLADNLPDPPAVALAMDELPLGARGQDAATFITAPRDAGFGGAGSSATIPPRAGQLPSPLAPSSERRVAPGSIVLRTATISFSSVRAPATCAPSAPRRARNSASDV